MIVELWNKFSGIKFSLENDFQILKRFANLWIDLLILKAYQPILGYSLPRGQGITFNVHSYLQFLLNCFFKRFFYMILSNTNIFWTELFDPEMGPHYQSRSEWTWE